jgi:hypothetical protein
MPGDMIQQVTNLLEGKSNSLDPASGLPADAYNILRQIARGVGPKVSFQLRRNALRLLGLPATPQEQDANIRELSALAQSDEPALAIQALRVLDRLKADNVRDLARAIMRRPDQRVDVALHAAWMLVRTGERDIAQDLRAVRARVAETVNDPCSPSLLGINRMIAYAEGSYALPSEPVLRPYKGGGPD